MKAAAAAAKEEEIKERRREDEGSGVGGDAPAAAAAPTPTPAPAPAPADADADADADGGDPMYFVLDACMVWIGYSHTDEWEKKPARRAKKEFQAKVKQRVAARYDSNSSTTT